MAQDNGPICISVINMKGGVGKTTITASLASVAAGRYPWSYSPHGGRHVLAIDLDPQANLSQALMGGRRYRRFLNDQSPSIAEVFDGYRPPTSESLSSTALDVADVVYKTGTPSLTVLPSRFDLSDRLVSTIRPDPRCLARLIADHFQERDLVIIDCAPTESIFTQAAYHASRYILVPVRPEFFATIGFPLLNDSLEKFRSQNRGHKIDVIGIVINEAGYGGSWYGGPERQRSIKEIRSVAKENGWHVFSSEIAYSRGFPKLMRGDMNYLGDSIYTMNRFADEFFGMPEMRTSWSDSE